MAGRQEVRFIGSFHMEYIGKVVFGVLVIVTQ